ncbi:MAG TPA: ATP-binding protein [Pseudobacteroides sp.]|uniref:ATP-binding protein n=1 Tax=Pseudobacteroides sp. TaxID=1968840 RepID=UPI002F928427
MNKLDILKKMLESNPQDADTLCLLAIEYRDSNDFKNAAATFSEALKYADEKSRSIIAGELSTLTMKILSQDIAPSTEAKANDTTISKPPNSEPSSVDEKSGGFKVIHGKIDLKKTQDTDIHSDTADIDEEDNLIPLKVLEHKRMETMGQLPVDEEKNTVSFSDVGGLDKLKDSIRMKIIKPFQHPGLFDRFRKKIGGGILLFGPPGCGKTFIARATAGECGAKFVPVHITDILDPYLGVSSQNIKQVFSTARARKPCILFFDEIDTIGYNRSKLSGDTMRPIIDQLLIEIEGIDSSTDKLLIIGATNMPWDVDPALRRPGRFDKSVFVPPPDEKARQTIFRLKMLDRPCGPIDYGRLANCTELYSGADIENVVESAAEEVIIEIMSTGVERPISMSDLLNVIERTKPTTIEWLRTIKNYVLYSNQTGFYDDVQDYLVRHKKLI